MMPPELLAWIEELCRNGATGTVSLHLKDGNVCDGDFQAPKLKYGLSRVRDQQRMERMMELVHPDARA